MLWGWPEETLTVANAYLAALWTAGTKDPDAEVTLDGLRPLMLIEVLRKAWVGIIISKSTSAWERHLILSPSQHGFRRGRGTDTALAEFINAREHAEELNTPLYTASGT